MFVAALLIGLREGLEASLIVGILLAYFTASGRLDQRSRIWWGVGSAVTLSVGLGALFTVGRRQLTFTEQEVFGGLMSLAAVGMVTWMVFWMLTMGRRMKGELHTGARAALAGGSGWALFWIAVVSVGREGVETTVMLWGWALEPVALAGALTGIAIAVLVGALAYRGLVRLNYAGIFRWTGVLLIAVAAGILAYGVHDLQEARLLPGPFSGHPITPTDLRTGEVLTGLTDGPFWMASFPFGWAFDLEATIDPGGPVATLLRALVGFTPVMSWLQVLAWSAYLAIVLPAFWRRARAATVPARPAVALAQGSGPAGTSTPAPTVPDESTRTAPRPSRVDAAR
jgi:high-affinity iron transporter